MQVQQGLGAAVRFTFSGAAAEVENSCKVTFARLPSKCRHQFGYLFVKGPLVRGLAGKTAIITGAGGAIGRAISRRFAEEGVVVGAFDIDGAAAEQTCQ